MKIVFRVFSKVIEWGNSWINRVCWEKSRWIGWCNLWTRRREEICIRM